LLAKHIRVVRKCFGCRQDATKWICFCFQHVNHDHVSLLSWQAASYHDAHWCLSESRQLVALMTQPLLARLRKPLNALKN
jgi:hypothetical protein